MLIRLIRICALSLLLFRVALAGDWQKDLDNLISATSKTSQDSFIKIIVSAKPDWKEVVGRIKSIKFPEVAKGVVVVDSTECIDGVIRPWAIYIPSTYSAQVPTPMIIYLHGLASRSNLVEDPKSWLEQSPILPFAEKNGWIILAPFAQIKAAWWDEVGMVNIINLVRTAKRIFNIDDDRVFMGGFSDGASASFLFAMIKPTDFAAFVALNGNMGVGSEDGNLPTYATNFFNSPIYAVTTNKDELYPSNEMEKLIDMGNRAGGNIYYRQLIGTHKLDYGDTEFPLIFEYLNRHPRDPFPNRIVWETVAKGLGQCGWLAIDEVTVDDPAPWYIDYNTSLIDSSLSVGFVPDYNFKGTGAMAASVIETDCLAKRLGLIAGDVIIKANSININNIDDLGIFKKLSKRGDYVEMVIKRGDLELKLSGRFPAPRNYFIFKREQPSAVAKATFSANKIDIQTSRVGALRIIVHPDMFRLEQNVIIAIDGKIIFNEIVKPDLEFMLRNFIENRDRKLLNVAEIKLRL